MSLRAALAALLILPVAACASGDSADDDQTLIQGEAAEGATEEPSEDEPTEDAKLIESGFGQETQYVVPVALVENLAEHGGQTVTVSWNLMDADGNLLTTTSQVESFSYAGQRLAVAGFADVGQRTKVASVEPTVLVEDMGVFDETDTELGVVKGQVRSDGYGGETARFLIENPLEEPMQNPRITAICKNKGGQIVGGGVDFPTLVPPGGEVAIEPDLTLSGKAATCTAYVGLGM